MSSVDERIVKMSLDNKEFNKNADSTVNSMKKIDDAMKFDTSGFSKIDAASKKVNFGTLHSAVGAIGESFNAMEAVAFTAIQRLTNVAIDSGKKIFNALNVTPVLDGYAEYNTKLNSIQTILTNTADKGTTLQEVTTALDELNEYADLTIYNFAEMTRNIGTFTAAGVDLDTAVRAIKGIANLGAGVGSSPQQVATAMYQLSQALASGTVNLQDWNSVVNAGMGGQYFQKALKETAKELGVIVDESISFRESISSKDGTAWLTAEILLKTLNKFADDPALTVAATRVKTITQLFDTMKESVGSGWAKTWEIVIGDLDEASEELTKVSQAFDKVVGSSAESRNEMLQFWKDNGGRKAAIEAITEAVRFLGEIIKPIKEAWREMFPKMTGERLVSLTERIRDFTKRLKVTDEQTGYLKDTFTGIFSTIKALGNVFKAAGQVIKRFFSALKGDTQVTNGILKTTASMGKMLTKFNETVLSAENLQNAVDKAGPYIDKFGGKIREVAIKVKDFFSSPDGIRNFISKIKDGLSEVKAVIEEKLGSIKNLNFKDLITGIPEFVSGFFNSLGGLSGIIEKLSSKFDPLRDKVNTVVTTIIDKFKTVTDYIRNIDLSDVVSKIVSVFTGMHGQLGNTFTFVKGLIEKVAPLKDFLDNLTKLMLSQVDILLAELGKVDFGKIFSVIETGAVYVRDRILDIVDIVKNLGTTLLSAIKPISQAWNEVFPQSIPTMITNILKEIKRLTGEFKLSSEGSKNLKDTFKGLFSVIDAGIKLIKGGVSIITHFFGLFSDKTGSLNGILAITGAFGRLLTAINEFIFSSKNIDGVVRTINAGMDILAGTVKIIVTVFQMLRELISPLTADMGKLSFSNLFSGIPGAVEKARDQVERFLNYLRTVKDTKLEMPKFEISSAYDSLKNGAGKMGNIFKELGTKILTYLRNIDFNVIVENVKKALIFARDHFGDFISFLSTFKNKAAEALGPFKDWLVDFFSGIGLEDVANALEVGVLASLVLGIKKVVKTIIDSIGGDLSSIAGAITRTFNALRDVLKTYQTQLRAEILDKIAKAVLALVAAIAAISLLPQDKVEKGLTAISIVLTELLVAMGLLSKIGPQLASAGAAVGEMLAVAVAVDLLAIALAGLSNLSWDEIAKGVTGLGILMLEMAAFLKNANGAEVKIAGMLALATGLKTLMKAIEPISKMNFVELAKGLSGLGVALLEVSLFAKAVGENGASFSKASVGMIAMATGLLELSAVIKIFANMGIADLVVGFGALAAALLEMSLALHAMKGTESGSRAMLKAAEAILVLAPGLKLLSTIGIVGTVQAIISLAAAFVTMGTASALLSGQLKNLDKLSNIMLKMSASAALLTAALILIPPAVLAIAAAAASLIPAAKVLEEAFVALIKALANGLARAGADITNAVVVLIEDILVILDKHAKPISDAIVSIINKILKAIDDGAYEFTNLLIQILLKVSRAIGDNADPILQEIVQLVIDLINGLANTIRDKDEAIIAALRNLLSSLIEMVITVLQEILRLVPIFGDEIADALEGAKEGIQQWLAPESLQQIGEEGMKGLTTGVQNGRTEFQNDLNQIREDTKQVVTHMFDGGEERVQRYTSSSLEKLEYYTARAKDQGVQFGISMEGIYSTGVVKAAEYGTNAANNYIEAVRRRDAAAGEAGKHFAQSAVDGIGSNNEKFSNYGTAQFNNYITNFKKNAASSGTEAGKYISQSVVTGLNSVTSEITLIGSGTGASYSNALKEGLKNVGNTAKTAATNVLNNLRPNTEEYKKFGESIGANYNTGLNSKNPTVVATAKTMISGVMNAIKEPSHGTTAKVAAETVANSYKNGLNASQKPIKTVAENLSKAFTNALTTSTNEAYRKGNEHGQNFVKGVEINKDPSRNAGSTLSGQFYSGLNGNNLNVKKAGEAQGASFVTGISGSKNSAKTEGEQLSKEAMKGASKYTDPNNRNSGFRAVALDAGRGFIYGLSDQTPAIKKAVDEQMKSALESAKKALNSHSPSKEFMKLGRWSGEGYEIGIENTTRDVANATAAMGEMGIKALSSVVERIRNIGDEDIDTNPVITPIVDLTNVEAAQARMQAIFSMLGYIQPNMASIEAAEKTQAVFKATKEPKEEIPVEDKNEGGTIEYNFTQYNTSPKPLSQLDIYRQTKNLFSLQKGIPARA